LLTAGAVALCAAIPAHAAAAAKDTVSARLAPTVSSTRGSGTFTASGTSGNTVVMRWQLSVSKLSGPVTRATLRSPGSQKIVFPLCSPCSAKSSGQLALIGSMWKRIVSKGGTIVISTRSNPAGELRGTLKAR